MGQSLGNSIKMLGTTDSVLVQGVADINTLVSLLQVVNVDSSNCTWEIAYIDGAGRRIIGKGDQAPNALPYSLIDRNYLPLVGDVQLVGKAARAGAISVTAALIGVGLTQVGALTPMPRIVRVLDKVASDPTSSDVQPYGTIWVTTHSPAHVFMSVTDNVDPATWRALT